MLPFTLSDARDRAHCLFECVTGSRAYGTDTPESNTDGYKKSSSKSANNSRR